MEPNELRIGNYVNLIAEGHEKEPDTFQWSIDDYEFYSDRIHFIEPIPLTEEWLLKFGFNYNDTYKIETEEDIFEIIYNDYHKFKLCFEGCFMYKEIKYVHQLQNLYFSLTGEELKII